jgi:hypothetical protein
MISNFNAIWKSIEYFDPCIVSTFLITSEVGARLMEIMLMVIYLCFVCQSLFGTSSCCPQ